MRVSNTGADLEVRSFMIYILRFKGTDRGAGIRLKIIQMSKNGVACLNYENIMR